MVNNYTIKMTPKVADDLDNMYRYISEELFAASAATNILEKIEKEIMRLKESQLIMAKATGNFKHGNEKMNKCR